LTALTSSATGFATVGASRAIVFSTLFLLMQGERASILRLDIKHKDEKGSKTSLAAGNKRKLDLCSISSPRKRKLASSAFPITQMEDFFCDVRYISKNRRHKSKKKGEPIIASCECEVCELGRCMCFQHYGYRECNANCKCGPDCANRNLQRDSKYQNSMEIFKTKGKNWGLRTTSKIEKGDFVLEYVGEVISFGECKKRSKLYDKKGLNYQLLVKEHFASSGLVLKHVIDATVYGNSARFINHCCSPNLEVRPLRVNNSIPHFALFSLRDIDEGEELTISYGGKPDPQRLSKATKCFCGSKDCFGYLPFDDLSEL